MYGIKIWTMVLKKRRKSKKTRKNWKMRSSMSATLMRTKRTMIWKNYKTGWEGIVLTKMILVRIVMKTRMTLPNLGRKRER